MRALLFVAAGLLGVSVRAQLGDARVDVVMDVPEPESRSHDLPFHVTGSCPDGHHLHLGLKPCGPNGPAVPTHLTVVILGELEMIHDHETFERGVGANGQVEVPVPGWAMKGYVSVHVVAEGVLLGTWEFVKVGELCGLHPNAAIAHEEVDFNGDLPSYRPN